MEFIEEDIVDYWNTLFNSPLTYSRKLFSFSSTVVMSYLPKCFDGD